MPLIVPDVTSNEVNKSSESAWMNELVGKKIGDRSNETTFAKADLPAKHRILEPDMAATCDWVPDRLNVHTAKDGIVTSVKFG
nr:uncharacterized protein c23d3.17 [Quercus suber]